MIDGNSVLGVILARGGSKGLPRKNIRDLAGKPLIVWTIEAGHESEYLDRLILSSDDEEIMSVADEHGCEVPFRRPDKLAQDDTSSMDTLLHAMNQMPAHDYTVLLQPTSPLRTASDIDAAIKACHETDAPACVTVNKTDKPPQWMYMLDENHHLTPVHESSEVIARRQDAQSVCVLNGAAYAGRTEWLKRHETFLTDKTVAHEMPNYRSVDIDDEIDFLYAEILFEYFCHRGAVDHSRPRGISH